jgi:hypothetical protein
MLSINKGVSHINVSTKLVLYFLIVLIAFLAIDFMASKNVSALSGSRFNPGRIIDDVKFYDPSTMSVQQIQQFLNSKVPNCDTNGSQAHSSGRTRAQHGIANGVPPPYICLKDYTQVVPAITNGGSDLCTGSIISGTKSAAQIIYESAQACGINPQVLLVLLQKEQSLITDDWPWPIQYRSATGYGCPDTAPCDAEFYGFFNQTYQAAKAYKRYRANPNNYNYSAGRNNNILWHPNASCGSSTVYIENQATAGLYIYTPYRPNQAALNNLYGTGDSCSSYGNRNFWRMYNDWFGTTTGTHLVRTPSSPTYYLLTNDKKYAIPNGDILYAYGLEQTELTIVSDSYLNGVDDGGILGTLFTIPGNPTTFLADGGKKYGIPSGEYCVRWGLACGDINAQKEIGINVSNRMLDGGTLKPLMGNQGGIFLMENGKKKPFLTQQAMSDRGYGFGDAASIINYTNAQRPVGLSLPENNTFIKFSSGSTIYLYSNEKFYSVPSLEILKNWQRNNTIVFNDSFSEYNTAPPVIEYVLSSLVNIGDGKTYLLDNGARIDVTSVNTNWPASFNSSSLSNYIASLPIKVTANSSSTFRTSNGAIYRIISNNRLAFAGVSDYFNLGYTSQNIIQLNSNSLDFIQNGILLMAEGRLFKKSGSDALFVVAPNNGRLSLTLLSQIGQFNISTSFVPNVDQTTFDSYTFSGTLNSLVTNGTASFLVRDGERISITNDIAIRYGLESLQKITFSNNYLDRLPITRSLGAFIQSEGGSIYYVENGVKRPFTSFEAFKGFGGSTTNTVTVPNDFLDQLPTGSPI